jgi:FlaA1/EpsC-like NDP-sugar epimerase
LSKRRVLVTGAGGSIGSELSRRLLADGCDVYMLDHNEFAVYELSVELPTAHPILADLRDIYLVASILERVKPEVVYHCAAHKHVHFAESNPVEVIKNNVLATMDLVEACSEHDCKVVFISTDKAVEPEGIYGASKLIGENLVLRYPTNTVVRLGNVLDSRGSAIPLFKKQIRSGGPVTLTHPEITRFFLSIPEAVDLIIKAASLSPGIYYLDMGHPVRIRDIAEKLIRDSGKAIEIVFTGLRPGERLEEKLLSNGDRAECTKFEKVMKIREPSRITDFPELIGELEEETASDFDDAASIRQVLARYIPSVR